MKRFGVASRRVRKPGETSDESTKRACDVEAKLTKSHEDVGELKKGYIGGRGERPTQAHLGPRPRALRLRLRFPNRRTVVMGKRVETATDLLAADPTAPGLRRRLFSAEQGLLLVRLAADSGARRGEPAALKFADLDGRVLTIERGLSRGVLSSTKSKRTRRLTLGSTTASMIGAHYSPGSRAASSRNPTGCLRQLRPGRHSSRPMLYRTSCAASAGRPVFRTRHCTASDMASPPTWSMGANY